MRRDPDAKRRHARLIIALAMAAGGFVSISLAWLGKWSGVREPLQISRSIQPGPGVPTTN